MSKFCDREKIYLGILMYLHIFGPPAYEKIIFGVLVVCQCTYV
jgi:hypothetical protein